MYIVIPEELLDTFMELSNQFSQFLDGYEIVDIKNFEQELENSNWWDKNIMYPPCHWLNTQKDIIMFFNQFKHR